MIELPELVIWLISEQLGYEDLQNLRVTCKRLKAIIDQKRFGSLHLFVTGYPFERELFHTGELVNYANSLHVSALDILKSVKFKSQFSGLLKLTINLPDSPPPYLRCEAYLKILNLDYLNCFSNLIHLELEMSGPINGLLSLRNLKIALFQDTSNFSKIQLDCPQLKALALKKNAFPSLPSLTVETISSIEHLDFDLNSNRFFGDKDDKDHYLLDHLYPNCKNLTTISFKLSEDLNLFVLALIERSVCLPELKRIELKESPRFVDPGTFFRNLSTLQTRPDTKNIEIRLNWKTMSGDELIEMRELLVRISTRASTFNGFRQSLPSFCVDASCLDTLRQFKENPILDCLVPGIHHLNFHSSEHVMLSMPLIQKLKNLDLLTFEKGIELDEQLFECILKKGRRIHYLHIRCASFKQQQLELMPNYLQNLRNLKLKDDFSLGNFNLDFVAKFKNLYFVEFDFNIKKETMSFLLKTCKNRQFFELDFISKQKIWILGTPNEKGMFEIFYLRPEDIDSRYFQNKKLEFNSIEDAIRHYYENDMFNQACESI